MYKNILIIADIEGSSGCRNYEASSFKTLQWAGACYEMTEDLNSVIEGLFGNGVERVIIKDFHRTGFNVLPDLLDKRAELISGYRRGAVPGIGILSGVEAVMFTGMHAASGTSGFLAHTMTSRISRLIVNDRLMSEVELFASSLAPLGIKPVFFSGCPEACRQAESAIAGIETYSIDKTDFKNLDVYTWRRGMAGAAVKALNNLKPAPYSPEGPYNAVLEMRDGEKAALKIASRWKLHCESGRIYIEAAGMNELYEILIKVCYFTPVIEKILPFALFLYNLYGLMGQRWVQRKLKKGIPGGQV